MPELTTHELTERIAEHLSAALDDMTMLAHMHQEKARVADGGLAAVAKREVTQWMENTERVQALVESRLAMHERYGARQEVA